MHLFAEKVPAKRRKLEVNMGLPASSAPADVDLDSIPAGPEPGDSHEGVRPLAINIAGTTCAGWSSMGKQKRFADVSERVHAVWLTEQNKGWKIASPRNA